MAKADPSIPPVIVWFRDDLRLSDHPALSAAAATGAPVICLYILDEISPQLRSRASRPHGGASRWWLAQSLKALQKSLAAHQQALVLRRGRSADIISEIARETGASAVYWNDVAIPPHQKLADSVSQALAGIGVAAKVQRGDLLAHPSTVRNSEGRGLRVFTPFWRRVIGMGAPPSPLPAPKTLRPSDSVRSDDAATWKLEPAQPDWAGGLRENWTPGEAAAQAALEAFLSDAIKGYANARDFPARPATSRLSPYLRFGEITPRQLVHAARFAAAEHPELTADIEKFLSELGWREFCRHLLFDHPALAEDNLQPSFNRFSWRSDKKALQAWQRGQTGYPIVDAGMRELWHTGVMHNRVRMVVASFLVKHLLIDWRAGEQWFWDTLVDADPGSNPANWQWVAGSGADAAPYFRIFNPVLQGEKFDPDGNYVRQWVPELAGLPSKIIHSPWTAKPMELEEAGVRLGKTYPEPIVDHKAARARALAAYAKTRA